MKAPFDRIDERAANSIRPIYEAAAKLKADGRLLRGTRVTLDLTADSVIEFMEAFKDPMGRP